MQPRGAPARGNPVTAAAPRQTASSISRLDDAVALGQSPGQAHTRLQGAFHVADERRAAVFAGKVQASQALFENRTDRGDLARSGKRITAPRERVVVPVDEIGLHE